MTSNLFAQANEGDTSFFNVDETIFYANIFKHRILTHKIDSVVFIKNVNFKLSYPAEAGDVKQKCSKELGLDTTLFYLEILIAGSSTKYHSSPGYNTYDSTSSRIGGSRRKFKWIDSLSFKTKIIYRKDCQLLVKVIKEDEVKELDHEIITCMEEITIKQADSIPNNNFYPYTANYILNKRIVKTDSNKYNGSDTITAKLLYANTNFPKQLPFFYTRYSLKKDTTFILKLGQNNLLDVEIQKRWLHRFPLKQVWDASVLAYGCALISNANDTYEKPKRAHFIGWIFVFAGLGRISNFKYLGVRADRFDNVFGPHLATLLLADVARPGKPNLFGALPFKKTIEPIKPPPILPDKDKGFELIRFAITF